MIITKRNSPNRRVGRSNWTPDFIVLHTTGGGSASGAISWVMNPTSQVSYHYIIAGNGNITQLVDIRNTAWANGTRTDGGNSCISRSTIALLRERRVNANLYSISIGFGDMPTVPSAAQTASAIWLIRHIRDEVKQIYSHDIPMHRSNIIGHNQISPIRRPNCPGRAFPFEDIIQRINELDKQATPKNTYKVQIGSFSSRSNAEAMLERARIAGFHDALITKITTTNEIDTTSTIATPIIQIGSRVKLKQSATVYGTNRRFSGFVYKDVWTVHSISGNRVVINRNVSGTNAIMSPVNVKDLILV